jgi:hypothetical protein
LLERNRYQDGDSRRINNYGSMVVRKDKSDEQRKGNGSRFNWNKSTNAVSTVEVKNRADESVITKIGCTNRNIGSRIGEPESIETR